MPSTEFRSAHREVFPLDIAFYRTRPRLSPNRIEDYRLEVLGDADLRFG